ncbi:hypothetical protein DESUT3_28900 [Desulfuromonas versatilis]|uniref:DUF11 domain-containing protein n=2 Tax=Desulfuromonas versatilis TaxID=2802975 RepID=A0ABN6E0A5_9BACT|nr:hypothetical protein DESUT3_28900 [Desulfuromonas versatilis]
MLLLPAAVGLVQAANNQATRVAGGATVGDSNVFTVEVVTPGLVKEIRDTSGNILNGGNVVAGSDVYFVIYLDNTTALALDDVRVRDFVDPTQFTIVNPLDPATFQILGTVATPGLQMNAANAAQWLQNGTGAGSWNALTWNTLTPAQGDDQLDWNLTTANEATLGAPNNLALTVPKSSAPDPLAEPYRVAIRIKARVN